MINRRRRGGGGGGKSVSGLFPHIYADFQKGVYMRGRERVAFSDMFTLTGGSFDSDGLTIDSATDALSISGANNGISSATTVFSMSLSGLITYTDNSSGSEATMVRWVDTATESYQVFLNTIGALTGTFRGRHVESGNVVVGDSPDSISAGTDVVFSFSSRVTPSAMQLGTSDGAGLEVALAGSTDLSATTLQLAQSGLMTLSMFRLWLADIGEDGLTKAV